MNWKGSETDFRIRNHPNSAYDPSETPIGYLIVNVEAQLKIHEGVFLDSMQLASILQRQYVDWTSRFRNGVIT